MIQHAFAAIRGEAEERANAADQRAAEERERRLEAEKRAEGITAAYREDVTRRGRKRGLVVGWGATALIIAVFLLGVVAAIPDVPLVGVKGSVHYLIWVAIGVFVLSNIATAIKDITLLDLREWISGGVERRICERSHRKLDELHAGAASPGQG